MTANFFVWHDPTVERLPYIPSDLDSDWEAVKDATLAAYHRVGPERIKDMLLSRFNVSTVRQLERQFWPTLLVRLAQL